MESVRWLHLTDLHVGMSNEGCLWANIEEAFFQDLANLHSVCGPWDFVVLTGDLVQKGHEGEYTKLAERLARIWGHLSHLGSKPAVLAVPGNHDLVRPPETDRLAELQDEVRKRRPEAQFWQDEESEYRRIVDDAFANYVSWWKNHGLPRPDENTLAKQSLLPGDFAATVRKGNTSLGVIGLNTAFLQLAPGEHKGKLALHPRQIVSLCGEYYTDWIREHHLCLLISHHPPQWLTEDAHASYREEIAPPGRFAAHLFGHMHIPTAETYSAGGDPPRRYVQGRSLFGLEQWGEQSQPARCHGYSVGELDISGEIANFRMWPRAAQMGASGGWYFSADQEFRLEMDGGTWAEPVALRPPLTRSSGIVFPAEEQHRQANPASPLGVHILPPHYLERTAYLDRLKNTLLAGRAQRVGVTSIPVKAGLKGMGGIGKTVLAAALAHDRQARELFCDGIVWIDFGHTAIGKESEIKTRQQTVAEHFEGVPRHFNSIENGTKHLQKLLGERSVLLVFDDVWRIRHVEPFIITGAGVRMLITTRNAQIIRAIGAKEHCVDVLEESDALELLARWTGQDVRSLPDEALEVVRGCGYLPLGVAIVGAMLRNKPRDRWQFVLGKLERMELSTIEHPLVYEHKNLLKAMQASVDDLAPHVREHYLELAVFPKREPILEETLRRFWRPREGEQGHSCSKGALIRKSDDRDDLKQRSYVADVVDALVDRSLLRREGEGRLTLHDILHAYIASRCENTQELSHRMIGAYHDEYFSS